MASSWRRISLRDAGVTLLDCVHKTPPAADDGYPYVAIPQMVGGRLYLEKARRISRVHFEEWTQKATPRGFDVVLSRRCNPGETAHVDPGSEFALGQNLVLLRSDGTQVHPPFLRWLVRGPGWWDQIAKFLNVGAVFNSLRCRDVPNFELDLPPLDEQCRIATVLGALDDKIELNRKMNRTLEEMAQAIFKSWFIDFDGNTDLVDSELGSIPRGWKVGAVQQLVEFNPRVQLPKGTRANFIDMKALPTAGTSIAGVMQKEFKGSGSKFRNDDVLLARIIPCLENGKTALVRCLEQDEAGFGSTEFIVMRGRDPVSSEYVYCLARSDTFRSHAISNMTGSSGRQRVPVRCFDHFTVAVPTDGLIAEFRKVTQSLFDRVFANSRESDTLSDLRDTLLPKLISGQVRVPEAERTVEEAL